MSSSKSNHTSADGHGDASGSSFVPGNKDPATVKGTTALGNANDKADDDDASNSSDVEMTGIELDNDDDVEMEEEEELDEDGANDTAKASTTSGNDPVAAEDETLLTEEAKELEEARKERLELMAAELQHKANLLGRGEGAAVAAGEGRPPSTSHLNDDDAAAQQQQQPIPLTPQERLEYLIAQSDVFAHFLAGSVAAGEPKGGKRKGRGGGGTSSAARGTTARLTEAEEDAQMLKSAQSKRRGVVRLDKQPSILAPICHMHPYQLEGLNWLIKLHDHGINGVLADEMGLGKTLQTISLLAYLRESRGVRGPHLVLVPKSVAGNWMRELKRWCPSIRAARMGGTKEERLRFIETELPIDPTTGRRGFDVLVASYEGLLKEKGRLSKVEWRYLIIDEAHRIKNEKSSLSLAVRQMNTQFRLLITGTPLQNNLRELWALLNFLMPDIFGDAEQFDEWFSLSDETRKENVIKKLHTVLRPFMLRRVKRDVAASLPPKKETKLYIGLTQLQQDWYVKVLQKDASELNKLGGPDRWRLLNVLMQLRKVCNHPYLFDGAEKGPPYVDGPHLWENSGKMLLMHKLLPKLKERGSRVLIFCQMTRVLDILEDYMRLLQYEYCRIDGNTDGERRDSQMDEFNAEGSTKFVFLLSTRAGGLGINLATADIVILYDSDFNPQVDLQAMDRAHRIGQTKPVQVFRFVTEGTVEEKIIERADRKLFLDAAVIQQGRLAEQNAALEKGDLMKMVRFGADQILSGKGGTYTDEDIDALIARGEEKTNEMQAKLETDAKHNLANFSLLGDDVLDTFSFEGKNYRDAEKYSGNFINLPQRQRKRNYDLGSATRETAGMKAHAADAAAKKKRKGPALHDFQLFDMDKLNAILARERAMAGKKEQQVKAISDFRAEASDAPAFGTGVAPGRSREELLKVAEQMEEQLSQYKLSDADEEERAKLLAEGFPDWSRKDFKTFCAAVERRGRYDFANISQDVMSETGKDLAEVQRYFVSFWTNYRRVAEWEKVLERIERGEKKILRMRQIRDAIQEKVERHLEDTFGDYYSDPSRANVAVPSAAELLHYSWPRMKLNYGATVRGKGYQEEEDAFLICMMYRHGYGAAERIRMEIRRAWQFRFDWYFKSRSALEIQKRCDLVVKIVERENEELRKKEEEKERIDKQSESKESTKQSSEKKASTSTTAAATSAAADAPPAEPAAMEESAD